MEEDWGAMSTGRPTFTLFKKLKPEEEAMKDSFVDLVVYNRWTRSERRLYQRLKTQNIVAKIEQEKCQSIDDITSCLEQLTVIRREEETEVSDLDDIIGKLEDMKLKASTNQLEGEKKKKMLQIKG